jgi:hypothetical protein
VAYAGRRKRATRRKGVKESGKGGEEARGEKKEKSARDGMAGAKHDSREKRGRAANAAGTSQQSRA